MNNSSYQQPEMLINIMEVIWDLLEQWKAVLIAALIMMVVVAGAKFYKDTKDYNESYRESEKTAQYKLTTEDRIAEILDNVSDEDVATVEYMIKQNDWMETEKEYMNKSILMNTNPANQRTLMLDYYISVADSTDSKMMALVYGYAGCLHDEKLIDNLGQVISPEAEPKYIAELISVNGDNSGNGNSSGDNKGLIIDSDAGGAVMEVCVVLTEDADASAAERVMTESLSSHTSELRSRIGNHSFNLIKASEAYVFNTAAVNNHNNIMNSIYNLYNAYKNMKTSLTDSQKEAIEKIENIKKEEEAESLGESQNKQSETQKDSKELKKPGISKKYGLLGFALGAMAYAATYLLYIIMRRRINYADDAETYTRSRLLGEIYKEKSYKGLRKLLHSRLVDKIRYKGLQDEETQLDKTLQSIEAVCKHVGIKEIPMLVLDDKPDEDGILGEIKERIISGLKKCGIKTEPLIVTDDFSEKELLSKQYAVYLLGEGSKISDTCNITALCDNYEVKSLGAVFVGAQ